MDTKSGYPFWALKNGLPAPFPQLARDCACEVLVIGGGITGALIADHLSHHGHEVVVVEQRDIAWGSTAASTALLQYEIDTHMVDLAKRYDEATAVLAYQACADAIGTLTKVATGIRDVGFARSDSLYIASKPRHVGVLAEEHAMRTRHGLPAVWLSAGAIRERYGFAAPAGICTDLAATVDPYRFACRLFARIRRRGAGVFDRTEIVDVAQTARGVTVRTHRDVTIRARHVVVAGGYQSQRWLKQRVAKNRSSYACISDPIDRALLGPLKHTMIWESARPYLYLRSTSDDRILVGGEDDAVDVPRKRDGRVHKRARQLVKQVDARFPHLELAPAFAWAGTFAETADGLPFFGAHDQHGSRILFAMAYGGNGITYSMLGAELLCALIERRPHPLAELFSFRRLGTAV
ncbi:MAG: FAD-dependent oxidoreductase [Kofleriaceae bacterium]